MTDGRPPLFTPFELRGQRFPNRVVISPMCQYSAHDGLATDWHFAHLSSFALGGAGCVFFEAAAVLRDGRITHGDLGIWSDAHLPPLRRIADFLKSQGGVVGLQIAHAGRKASMQRPWHGNGPLDETDRARGEVAWPIMAPSPLPIGDRSLVPAEMTADDMARVRDAFAAAARRADAAGIDVVEIHGAHGYLLHSFLSPVTNHRTDGYGGARAARMRFPLEVAAAVRAAWPADRPLFYRISSVDGLEEGGWQIGDSVAFARELGAVGVDLVDCSSGGIGGSATAARIPRVEGFQVPFAAAIRRGADIPTMAVGLILEAAMANDIVASGQADLVAIARQALYDPFWARHAAHDLGIDKDYAGWPEQYGWWLDRRDRFMGR
jgi:2,4-dienoyl-CoA reductase-like NADH-dependent reductase (Old Yellow Enzyme family)